MTDSAYICTLLVAGLLREGHEFTPYLNMGSQEQDLALLL